jgi:hypothetical protein
MPEWIGNAPHTPAVLLGHWVHNRRRPGADRLVEYGIGI